AICDMVLAENASRSSNEKKLYVMYDQMYWHLTYDQVQHYNPVSLRPAMKEYTIFIDAISKVFASTGVRVGWSMGPSSVLSKMKAILTHVGAWAPMAEQKAVASFLAQKENIDTYLRQFKLAIQERLQLIYTGLQDLKNEGFPVDAIAPQGAIYLTVQFDLAGKKSSEGIILANQEAVTAYLLNAAQLAVVPFYAFGADRRSPWYRLSVGTCRLEQIPEMLQSLRNALKDLN
ncbi:MAG TPA: aminotransferase class I/II-fold pyridoxal phosphate-dependent enzyme, partial [Chitinophagaceae bacterium]|nr:aminotransferase class I/II-fold pyridoxal phosphate-dependent enzyme [Chitinophagaceae bacterium]